jgi:hypothetical protein
MTYACLSALDKNVPFQQEISSRENRGSFALYFRVPRGIGVGVDPLGIGLIWAG